MCPIPDANRLDFALDNCERNRFAHAVAQFTASAKAVLLYAKQQLTAAITL